MRIKTLILTAIVVSCFVAAQAQDKTEAAAKALEQKWATAMEKCDTATLNNIFVPTYVDTDEHGNRTDMEGVIAACKSHDLKITSLKLSDLQVRAYGDAAVVTGKAEQKGTYKGQALMLNVVFTDTLVKQGSTWKAAASQRAPAK